MNCAAAASKRPALWFSCCSGAARAWCAFSTAVSGTGEAVCGTGEAAALGWECPCCQPCGRRVRDKDWWSGGGCCESLCQSVCYYSAREDAWQKTKGDTYLRVSPRLGCWLWDELPPNIILYEFRVPNISAYVSNCLSNKYKFLKLDLYISKHLCNCLILTQHLMPCEYYVF